MNHIEYLKETLNDINDGVYQKKNDILKNWDERDRKQLKLKNIKSDIVGVYSPKGVELERWQRVAGTGWIKLG